MKGKVSLSVLLILLVGILLIGGCSSPATSSTPATKAPATTSAPSSTAASKPAGNVMVIRAIAGEAAASEVYSGAINPFLEAVNKQLQGEVRIDWVGSVEVVPVPNQSEALRNGTIDMILLTPMSATAASLPAAIGSDMSELTGAQERANGAFNIWSEAFEKQVNARLLGLPHNGPGMRFYTYTSKPVEKMDDLKGKKIRVTATYEPFAKALGASPMNIPLADTYTALQNGVVEGVMTNASAVNTVALFEVLKCNITPGFYEVTGANYMNLNVWNKLSKKAQDIITQEAINQENRGVQFGKDIEAKYLASNETNSKGNLKTITLSQADAQKYLDLAYKSGWDYVLSKDNQGYAARLQPLLTKK